jgi:hypothetical protein
LIVTNRERAKLLYASTRQPRARRGRKLFCEIDGTVTVGGD